MKKIIVLLLLSSSLKAQDYKNLKSITPVYFVMDSLSGTSNTFTKRITDQLPDYHLVSFDTSRSGRNVFNYENGEDKLNFLYDIEEVGGNPDLKLAGVKEIRGIIINGQFLTMLKVYNYLFGESNTVDDFKTIKAIYSPVVYKNNIHRYHLIFDKIPVKAGYWSMQFRWFAK